MLDRPLGLGESRRIDFSLPTLAMYLAKGFHRSDGWCVWSSQRHAQIRVPVSADAVVHGATLQIDMEIRAYEGTLSECPAVRISSGGVVLALALFRPSSPEAQHIQLTRRWPMRAVSLTWNPQTCRAQRRPAVRSMRGCWASY